MSDFQQKTINTQRVVDLLDRSTQQLDDQTLAALKRSREMALQKQLRRKSLLQLATGQVADWIHGLSLQQWAMSMVLVVMTGVAGINYWQQMDNQEHDGHVDVALLTDDLPLETFVD